MQAKAIVFFNNNCVEIQGFELRNLEAGEVLVETVFSCVSPGTELRCLCGAESNAARFPFIPGYALVGHVIETGLGVKIDLGTRVFCKGTRDGNGLNLSWGGHVSHAICSADTVVPIPEAVDTLDASATSLAAIAYHGMRLTRPFPDEKVLIVGLGVIGQLSARLHSLNGADVIACDLSPKRVEIAQSAGIYSVAVGGHLKKALKGFIAEGFDIVVDATGMPAVAGEAIGLAKDIPWDNSPNQGARILIQGSYEKDISIPYHEAFNKEITVLFPRSEQERDEIAVIDLMSRGGLKVRDLITRVCSFDTAAQSYKDLQDINTGIMTIAFQWKEYCPSGDPPVPPAHPTSGPLSFDPGRTSPL